MIKPVILASGYNFLGGKSREGNMNKHKSAKVSFVSNYTNSLII